MQFVPLWDSILDNLKIHRLGPELLGKWALMLVAAQRHDCYEGRLPDLDTLAFWLREEASTIREWLGQLVAAKVVDMDADGYSIHDWNDWRCVKDKTSRARVQRHRDKKRNGTTKEPCNGDVTPPVTPASRACNGVEASNDQRSFASAHSQTAAETRPACVSEDLEPFDPGPATVPLATKLPPDKQRVLDRQTERWGASNGDRVVSDLLRDYSAEIVAAACDHHYLQNNGVLMPTQLGGICRAMFNGTWKLPAKARSTGTTGPPTSKTYPVIRGP